MKMMEEEGEQKTVQKEGATSTGRDYFEAMTSWSQPFPTAEPLAGKLQIPLRNVAYSVLG